MSDLLAGRALDAMIAEKVMGFAWEPIAENEIAPPDCTHRLRNGAGFIAERYRQRPVVLFGGIRPFSTDIAAAFSVVEAMKAKGYRWRIGTGAENESPTYAAFWNPEHTFAETYSAECSTPAFAICLAALRAIAASTPPGNPQ